MGGKTAYILAAAICLAAALFATGAQGKVEYKETTVNGIDLSIIDITGEKLVPIFAAGSDYANKVYKDETFGSIIARASVTAAINGCFFDTVTDRPIGDIAAGGKKLIGGGGWAYFGIKNDGTPEFGTGNPVQSRKDWKGYSFGLTCLPLLVRDGKQLIKNKQDMRAAGFKDPVVYMKMTRAAIASASGGRIYLIASSPANMYDFAAALLAVGADNALGLDGGSATGLYFKGSFLYESSMNLTHIFAVVGD